MGPIPRILSVQLEVHHQGALDAEDRIGIEVPVPFREQLGDDAAKAGSGDDEMRVRRAERMPVLHPEELPHRPVGRDGIADRFQGVELVPPVAARLELPAQVHARLRGVLDVVEAVLRRLPDVEERARDRLPRRIEHAPSEGGRLRRILRREIGPRFAGRRALDIEGAQHRAFRPSRGAPVGDRVDEHRHTERVGEEDEFLPVLVALLPGRGEEPDRLEPLCRRELDFPHDRMDVADDALEDLLRTRVLAALDACEHRVGQVCLGEVAHRSVLARQLQPALHGKEVQIEPFRNRSP